jgi:hypothetical protein
LCRQYNADLFRAATALGRKASKGEVYAKTAQMYLAQSAGRGPIEEASLVITSFAKARDLGVVVRRVDASWQVCKESLVRDMPFLLLQEEQGQRHLYVCVGYAEQNGNRHLFALDPLLCTPRTRRGGELISPGDRALGGEAAAVAKSLSARAVLLDDYLTAPSGEPIPGLVVLRVRAEPLACMFVFGWRRDREALGDRVAAILKETRP